MSWENNNFGFDGGNGYTPSENNENVENSWDNSSSEDNNYNSDQVVTTQNDNFQNENNDDLGSLLNDEDSNQEETTEERAEHNIEVINKKIEDELQRTPNNASTDEEFSVRDVYKIYNVMIILDAFGEDVTDWVTSTLAINTNGKPIRKAIEIAQMNKQEFDSRSLSMSILRAIYEVDHYDKEGGDVDPVHATIDAMNKLAALQPDEKFAVISLVKSLVKDSGSKSGVRATRTSPDPEIFSEIRKVLNENDEMSYKVSILDAALSTIREKAL